VIEIPHVILHISIIIFPILHSFLQGFTGGAGVAIIAITLRVIFNAASMRGTLLSALLDTIIGDGEGERGRRGSIKSNVIERIIGAAEAYHNIIIVISLLSTSIIKIKGRGKGVGFDIEEIALCEGGRALREGDIEGFISQGVIRLTLYHCPRIVISPLPPCPRLSIVTSLIL